MSEDYELYHYGVLGMKWGVHKNGDAYRYTSHATKKYSKKASKYETKANKTTNSEKKQKYTEKSKLNSKKAKISQEIDDKMLSNVKKTGLATTAYGVGTFGTGLTKTYQTLQATNQGKKSEIVKNKKENLFNDSHSLSKTLVTNIGADLVGEAVGGSVAGITMTTAHAMGATVIGATYIGSLAGAGVLRVAEPAISLAVRTQARNNYINSKLDKD